MGEWLLASGADLHRLNDWNCNAAHFAALAGNLETLQWLHAKVSFLVLLFFRTRVDRGIEIAWQHVPLSKPSSHCSDPFLGPGCEQYE